MYAGAQTVWTGAARRQVVTVATYESAALAPAFANPVGRNLMASVLGDLLLGNAAKLDYGCNIRAFFSAIASDSVHGWLWTNLVELYLRPLFDLPCCEPSDVVLRRPR